LDPSIDFARENLMKLQGDVDMRER